MTVSKDVPTAATQADTHLFGKPEVLLALGLLLAFFLPWVRLFFFKGSGYDVGIHLSGKAQVVWLFPTLAVAVIVAAIQNLRTRVVCLIAGALPYVALAWGASRLKSDVFRVLTIGAYLSLGFGAGLLIVGLSSLFAKSPPPRTSAESTRADA